MKQIYSVAVYIYIYIYIYILITNEDRKQFSFNPPIFRSHSVIFFRVKTGERDAWDNFLYIYIYIYILQLFTEVEVASIGYLLSRESSEVNIQY